MSQIGIKLANHDFFPIIDDISSLPIEKEVELTTVRDAQPAVQINLFLKDEGDAINYIGTLMIEDLKDASFEDASILLSIHLDKEKNLRAEAVDKNTGNKQSFSISIENLDQNNLSVFDFDVEDSSLKDIESSVIDDIDLSFTDIPLGDDVGDKERMEEGSEGASEDDFILDENQEPSFSSQDIEEKASKIEGDQNEKKGVSLDEDYLSSLSMYEGKKTFPTWLKIFLVLLIVCILALVIALFLKDNFRRPKKTSNIGDIEKLEKIEEKKDIPIKKTSKEDILTIDTITTEAPKKETEPFLQEKKVIVDVNMDDEEDVQKDGVAMQDESIKDERSEVEDVKKIEGGATSRYVRYRLRSGDTLWDLAESFYKNPWQYKKIAKYNGIENPSRIIAGTCITIPAK